MLQGPYTISSVSSLSLDRSNQSDSPNGKIIPAVLCHWWQNRHCLVKFWKCQTALSILPHEAKALLELFCLQANIFGWRQNSSSSYFASWGIIKMYDFTWPDQDWIGLRIFKNFADQDWIGFNFIGSGLDSDWNISLSANLCCTLYRIRVLESIPAGYFYFFGFGFGLDWITFPVQPDPDYPNDMKCGHAKNLDPE